MSTAPEDGPGLTVTVGRPWNPSVDGPPPTPDQLRPHLTAQQREFLEQFRRGGEHLHTLLGVAVEGCPSPAGWRPTDDAEVRGCLYALAVCRDMTRRAEGYSAEANQSLRIEAGESLSSRLPGVFLDNDPRFDILRAAVTLRGRITEYVDWLTVAARHRGILAAGQPLDSSSERQLGYAVTPGTVAEERPAPPEEHRPRWDATTRTLWFGAWSHQYRKRAPGQERVLAGFQQAGWPERIATGLPQNLSGIVRNIGTTLGTSCPLVFEMDGTGEGVRWCQRGSSTEVS